ncbi:unnamed protein product [Pieris macdunnoughi]|uniref:Uncharacterized protein n=1 Tax=Pieris macdunnoughi TaxID=345717 RepID=A0A821PN01_9NEOP|nr:unnamed protein product [Pieris macdunnoughi]
MGIRLLIFMCLMIMISALPNPEQRNRRDVMDTIKQAGDEVAKTLNDAGDAVVQVFKPTEKNVLDKMADGIKGLAD